jgi:hypothetical protein
MSLIPEGTFISVCKRGTSLVGPGECMTGQLLNIGARYTLIQSSP